VFRNQLIIKRVNTHFQTKKRKKMAKGLLTGKLSKDKVQASSLTPEQVEAMHQAMTAVPIVEEKVVEATPTITKITTPTKVSNSTKPKTTITNNTKKIVEKPVVVATPEPTNEVITRLSIDVSKEMHKKMKLRVIDTEQSIRDYVIGLIKSDLGI
jgi:putative lipoic acid-binding regulatory protein